MIRRVGRRLTFAAILAGAAGAIPSPARAQGKIELTPFLGSFYALGKMCSDCGNDGANIRLRLLNSAAFGGRLTYRLTNTLAIEGLGAYTPSRIELSAQDTSGFALGASAKGNVILASARLLYRPARTNLSFIVGGGMVHRGGDAWKAAKDSAGTKTTSPAAVLGVGVRASVTPKFALLISAEASLYSFDPNFGPPADRSNGSKLQSDLLFTIGVPLTLAH
jgi:hypothetical protein